MSGGPFAGAVALRATSADAFVGRTQPVPWPKAYGGDLLAQAVAAATRTVAEDRALNAAHTLFVSPATVGGSVDLSVATLRDGRSYSTRQVTAREGERIVAVTLASYHVGEESALAAATPMPAAPAPDDVPGAAAALAGERGPAAEYWSSGRGFELRHVEGAPYVRPVPGGGERMRVWIRADAAIPAGQPAHRAALAYVCDYAMLEPALSATGLHWTRPGLVTASTDHALWIHADVRADEWMLCTLDLVHLGSGRATVRAEFHAADGTHVASAVQQGVIRLNPTTEERS
ncbi:acyl-CoA thioesterase [Microbacterium sp. ZXX196]|uniref:acyl-CoA thioesterase n=1 Tax=Microbacterium sp. ZXX196 TaxID=2609291 RepID=UPI0034D22B87